MNKVIYTKNMETLTEKNRFDMSIFKKRSSAKTSKGLVIGMAKKLQNSPGTVFSKMEMLSLFATLHKQISNLETSETLKIESWKGKSGLKFIIKPDKVICISYQKFEKDSEPKEIKTKITRQEINDVIRVINKLDEGKKIKTSEIGELVYGEKWKNIFSNRKKHILLTKIYNYLEYRGDVIYYRSGKIKVLRKITWW